MAADTALDTRVTADEGATGAADLTQLQTDVAALQAADTALQTADTDLGNRVTTLETLPATVTTLQTSVLANCNKLVEVTDLTAGVDSNTC